MVPCTGESPPVGLHLLPTHFDCIQLRVGPLVYEITGVLSGFSKLQAISVISAMHFPYAIHSCLLHRTRHQVDEPGFDASIALVR